MTTQQLDYFICLTKHLNFTSAASELNISVSTLSRNITALEAELNVQLLFRDNKKVRLTESGKYFLKEISDIQQNLKIAMQNTQRIYQGFRGTITCGILEDFTLNGIMQDYFHSYLRSHPECKIDLRRGSYHQLVDGVLDGTYDFIISFLFALENMIPLKYKIVEKIKEGFLVSSKNPLAKEKHFDPMKFKNQTFILISKDENEYVSSGPLDFFFKQNIRPNIIIAPNIDAATLWTEAGMGISFSYEKSVGAYNPALTFLPMKEGGIMTHAPYIVLAWNPGNLNPAAKEFIRGFKSESLT